MQTPPVASLQTIATVGGVGLFTTSAVIIGATLGLYLHLSKNVLAAVLAFAAGVLISSLGIELAYHSALGLHERGFSVLAAWAFVSGGFAVGATVYFTATRFLDRRGAAVRSATRFAEYALERRQEDIELLSKVDLLRHLPPQAIESLLTNVRERHVGAGETVFQAGDPGDALYIVASGRVAVLHPTEQGEKPIAELGEGKAFGEMALLSGAPRTATIRALEETELLQIEKTDFDRLVALDRDLAVGLQRLSHERALSNLAAGGTDPDKWAKVAASSLDRLSKRETDKMLTEAGHGAGLAIMLGDLLDTIPGLVVVGAKFTSLHSLSLPVMMGIFIGGIPESAASAALLRKAGFAPRTIYSFWSVTLIAGILSAVAGKVFIGNSESLVAVFAEAMAGGSLLALVSHAMVPEALHQGGSAVVLPTVAGFLLGLYLILAQSVI
jgi:CRP-like cAMP-binding protein